MVSRTRTGVSVLLVAALLVISQVALVSPATAATPVGPDWVPAQSVIPSSKMTSEQTSALVKGLANSKIGTSSTNWHLQLQTAAAKGAYVPGLSDAAKALGVSPYAVTPAQASASYSSYVARPGSASVVAAQANSRGVVSVTTLGTKGGALVKGGKAMSALGSPSTLFALVGWEMGTAIGHGFANFVGLPTSGSIVCDLMTAAMDSDCALQADKDYVPNEGLVEMPPGMPSGNTMLMKPANPASSYPEFTVRISVDNGLVFGSIPSSTSIMGTFSGFTCSASNWQALTFGANAIYHASSSGLVAPSSIGTPYIRSTCDGDKQAVGPVRTQQSSYYDVFDHLEFVAPGAYVAFPEMLPYYPPGHELWTPGVESDPIRWFTTEYECTRGPGGVVESARYRESDDFWATPAGVECAAGEVSKIKVYQHTQGMTTAELLYEWEIPPKDAHFLETYPQCAAGECVLDLRTSKTGVEVSCFQSPELCVDWLKDPNRERDFQCYYAGLQVIMSECFLYGPTFNRGEVEEGSIYGDPETGEPLVPEVDPSNPPAPGTGTGGGTEPPQDPSCPPPFSGLNLFNPWWYWKGITCGLSWAFVPGGAGVGGVASGIFGAYEASAASGLVDSTKRLFSVPLDGSCGVLFSVEPSVFKGNTFKVDTCTPFWSGASPIRTLLGISMVLYSTIAGLRLALSALGISMFDGKGQP